MYHEKEYPCNQTHSAAEMAFMFAEWYRPDVVLDYPVGTTESIVNALVRGLNKYGGELRLSTHVEEIGWGGTLLESFLKKLGEEGTLVDYFFLLQTNLIKNEERQVE